MVAQGQIDIALVEIEAAKVVHDDGGLGREAWPRASHLQSFLKGLNALTVSAEGFIDIGQIRIGLSHRDRISGFFGFRHRADEVR